jgi:hypothetical protein
LALLMGAGLFIHSFARLLHVNPGFQPANVLTLLVQMQFSVQDEANAQQLKTLYERLELRLRSLPGVKAVAATNAPPFATERNNVMRFAVPGSPLMRPDVFPVAHRHLITPDYFRALGIPLRGRSYTAHDLDGPYVIVKRNHGSNFLAWRRRRRQTLRYRTLWTESDLVHDYGRRGGHQTNRAGFRPHR